VWIHNTVLHETVHSPWGIIPTAGKHITFLRKPYIYDKCAQHKSHTRNRNRARDLGFRGERQVTDFRNIARNIKNLDIELSMCYRLVTGIELPNTLTLSTLYFIFQTIYNALDTVHCLECFQSKCNPLVQWLTLYLLTGFTEYQHLPPYTWWRKQFSLQSLA